MILVFLCRADHCHEALLAVRQHLRQTWTKPTIEQFSRNIASAAVVRHLKTIDTGKNQPRLRRVFRGLGQRASPGVASKHDLVAIQKCELHHAHLVLDTGLFV